MAERGQGSKLSMPKPEEHLLVGDCFGGQGAGGSWDLGVASHGPLGEERFGEGAPCLKLPQPLWNSGRPCAAASGSRGPSATLTSKHSQFQLWSSLAHTCLGHSRTLGGQGEASSCGALTPCPLLWATWLQPTLAGP
uniref:Uncharacterized protein n=1 Tax=Myotis myotis TaxID=51298 RepID=A0A7J7SC32_MYOMY|nr:hypothetical protein mMyoMyo1_009482 [Myotis myotis]